MRKLILIVPLLLSACSDFTAAEQEERGRRYQAHYQERLDKAPILCRDGVEYILMSNTHGDSVSPHLKPDGKPFTC